MGRQTYAGCVWDSASLSGILTLDLSGSDSDSGILDLSDSGILILIRILDIFQCFRSENRMLAAGFDPETSGVGGQPLNRWDGFLTVRVPARPPACILVISMARGAMDMYSQAAQRRWRCGDGLTKDASRFRARENATRPL